LYTKHQALSLAAMTVPAFAKFATAKDKMDGYIAPDFGNYNGAPDMFDSLTKIHSVGSYSFCKGL
jgi:hypothetical protein